MAMKGEGEMGILACMLPVALILITVAIGGVIIGIGRIINKKWSLDFHQ